MNRYTDADVLIKKYINTDIERFSNSDVKIVLENLKQNILKAPSIDIVRCRECKRAEHEPSGIRCGLSDVLMGEDGFCSIGEREDDDR